jgi:hypothetical protein
MEYGALFEGKLGNVLFSDTTPSIVFMGKATASGTYGTKMSHIGGEYFGNSNDPNTSEYTFRKSGVADDAMKMYTFYKWYYFGWNSLYRTTTRYRTDNCRTTEYTVEAYDKPIVFIQYLDPDDYGGMVVKIEDNGTTGSRGYANWTITVLLYYSTAGNHATASSKIVLYCFSKMDSTYSNTSYGMEIKNAAGSTMFHSDYAPCQVKEMMTITTGSDPSVDFSSTLLDSTGVVFGSISKPCYYAQDWGRLKRYDVLTNGIAQGTMRFTMTLFPYAIRYVSGDDFHAQFGGNFTTDAYYTSTTKATEFVGAAEVAWAVIDGNDYD